MRQVEDDWPEFWEQVEQAVTTAGSSLDRYRIEEHPHVRRVFSLDWELLEPLLDGDSYDHIRFRIFVVGEALAVETRHIDGRRARDAIAETLEFALPLASDMTRRPGDRIVVDSPSLDSPFSLGSGDRTATLEGEPHSLLSGGVVVMQ